MTKNLPSRQKKRAMVTKHNCGCASQLTNNFVPITRPSWSILTCGHNEPTTGSMRPTFAGLAGVKGCWKEHEKVLSRSPVTCLHNYASGIQRPMRLPSLWFVGYSYSELGRVRINPIGRILRAGAP